VPTFVSFAEPDHIWQAWQHGLWKNGIKWRIFAVVYFKAVKQKNQHIVWKSFKNVVVCRLSEKERQK